MDREKIREFRGLVRGAERYAKPYKLALVISNALWAAVVLVLLRNHQD
jgi:hypothetical protein